MSAAVLWAFGCWGIGFFLTGLVVGLGWGRLAERAKRLEDAPIKPANNPGSVVKV